jgi:hypothetical protein
MVQLINPEVAATLLGIVIVVWLPELLVVTAEILALAISVPWILRTTTPLVDGGAAVKLVTKGPKVDLDVRV